MYSAMISSIDQRPNATYVSPFAKTTNKTYIQNCNAKHVMLSENYEQY